MKKILVAFLAIFAAACSSAGPGAPQHSGSAHALSARVVLASRTITAGSSIRGRVVVTNNTGRPIHTWGCGTLFQVALTGNGYQPSVAWHQCLQPFTIPAGVSSYRVTVDATYLRCGESQAPGSAGGCLPGGGMPPLPAGNYRAMLFQSRHLVQAPHGIPVRVITHGPAGG